MKEVYNMSLQVNLKLKLSKIKKSIKVKYNTFEKATYDEFLVSSLALRCKSDIEAYSYIDDITGDGSLNPHFKSLFEQVKGFSEEQLTKIMENSMFPILKIDDSNWYFYYPQVNLSEYKNRIYQGDFGLYPNLLQLIYIKEDVIEQSIYDIKTFETPEPYFVELNKEKIKVKIKNDWIDIQPSLFESLIFNELNSIDKYKGIIHSEVNGEGWNILNNSTINNLFANKNFFYNSDGDHCQIREDSVRKTTVSLISSLYIYRETIIRYSNNRELCETVINYMLENNAINSIRINSLLNIIKFIDELKAQQIINYILDRNDSREMTLFGLELLKNGLYKNWSDSSLQSFLKYSSGEQIEYIYKANSNLKYNLEQLIKINKELLSPKHKKQIDKYYQDLCQMKETIKNITGEVAVSGMRESVKELVADSDTKRFSKLCNNLFGHLNMNLENAAYADTERWLNEAIELKELMIKLSAKLDNNKTKEHY